MMCACVRYVMLHKRQSVKIAHAPSCGHPLLFQPSYVPSEHFFAPAHPPHRRTFYFIVATGLQNDSQKHTHHATSWLLEYQLTTQKLDRPN